MNHNVESRGNLRAVQAHNLTDAPADTVADDRGAQLPLHARAEAAAVEPVRTKKNSELAAGAAPPVAVDGVELRAPQESRLARVAPIR